ncbi:MAG: histidine kinase, partial [Rhodobacteraceae bacterium CG17_big_fil_post_rev_8_21_14_2_50_65_11]
IVTFNLIALNVLVIGILYLNGSQASIVQHTVDGLRERAALSADVVAARLPQTAPVNLATGDGIDLSDALDRVAVREGTELFLFDPAGTVLGRKIGDVPPDGAGDDLPGTPLTDLLTRIWGFVSAPFAPRLPQDNA